MKKPIQLIVNDITLRGNLYMPNEIKKKPLILFLHGWTGKPNEQAASKLAEQGFGAMTFSLSGHNDSDGKLEEQTRQKSLLEVIAAYDFLRSQSEAEIVAVGNSYGGYMATLLSAKRELAAISLRVPANYPDEKFEGVQLNQRAVLYRRSWRDQPLDFKATRSLKAVHDFIGPIQIIEAELDELVPHQTILNYVNAVNTKAQLDYQLMKNWPHSIGDSVERERQFEQILLNWLYQQV